MTAKTRYDYLSGERTQFLSEAEQAAELTLPYLITKDQFQKGMRNLPTPYQAVGAKLCTTLASKLMLAMLPVQTSFFKLQVDESQLGQEFGPQVKSELDLSFAKIERTITEAISASNDRVVIHEALLHLIVGGNVLIFMSKDGLKLYPLNRYVVEKDGSGNVIEIITKETIAKKLIEDQLPPEILNQYDSVVDKSVSDVEECDIYTYVKRDNNRFVWHQEVHGKILEKSRGKAPIDLTPWLPLTWNSVEGENYGRGRCGQFIGDLKSLEGLSQALVEGSAAAAKVVFTLSPSSTTKPSTLSNAPNGAIISSRPDDVGVITVGKTADFKTAFEMTQVIEKRLNEAFLADAVRDSERTTAEEVRMTQTALERQLAGIFQLLTTSFLLPYLNRYLNQFQKQGKIPRLPKNIVKPTLVAGINALGRNQDAESLGQFLTIVANTMGPEAVQKFINPEEVVKRLAAAQGIETLNLVRSMQEIQGQEQQAQQMAMQAQQAEQQTAMLKTPIMDPSKNPALAEEIAPQSTQNTPPPEQL
tara:strand:- start:918 stop:2510 length:1593 start_codon:yes stop_codon:yes gene_type:complete